MSRLITLLILVLTTGLLFSQSISVTKGPNYNTARMTCRSIRLDDGKVVVIGGHGYGFVRLGSAEIYNPTNNTMTQYALNDGRDNASVTKLQNGKYFIAGGMSSDLGVGQLTSTEIFDPANLTFTPAGNLVMPRTWQFASTLKSGNVLLVGCWWSSEYSLFGEIYNPLTGISTLTDTVLVQRSSPYIVPTTDGNALVFGGSSPFGGQLSSEQVELYNITTNKFTTFAPSIFNNETGWNVLAQNLPCDEKLMRLKDGKYLYMGSKSSNDTVYYSLFTVDPTTKEFTKYETNPPLPFFYGQTGKNIMLGTPVVDTLQNRIYILGQDVTASSPTDYVYIANTVSRNLMKIESTPINTAYYLGYSAVIPLLDKRLFIGGGNYSDNFNAVDSTLLVSFSANDVENEVKEQNSFSLNQNFPNPVISGMTTIRFYLPNPGYTKLTIFNNLGEVVNNIDMGLLSMGVQTTAINTSNLSSGVYFYRITSSNYSAVKKMLVVK